MTLVGATPATDTVRDVVHLQGNNSELIMQDSVPDQPISPRTARLNAYGINRTMYLEKLARLETGSLSDPYRVVNRFGYMGKYQFGLKTLNGLTRLGYLPKITRRAFLASPELQEQAINALIEHNLNVLSNYGLMKYVGKTVRGVHITKEGLLAGAHLLGPYAVKQFIEKGRVGRDGNNTSITNYIKQFEYDKNKTSV